MCRKKPCQMNAGVIDFNVDGIRKKLYQNKTYPSAEEREYHRIYSKVRCTM